MSRGDGSALRGYAICTAPRSGSNWLCQLLTSTGLLGRPLEYFNGPGRRQLDDPSYPDDPHEQVGRILTMGRTANGVYGVKMFAGQFREAANCIDFARDLPNLQFVYLRRRDVVGQAISWVRALQTSQYRSTQPLKGAISYDHNMIADRLRTILDEYSYWSGYFVQRGLSPVEIVYEDMLDNAQPAVAGIAGLFGITASTPIGSRGVDLTIQRDAHTQEWRARFIAEDGAVGMI